VHIKVLGSGCRNCRTLEARTRAALGDLGVSAEIDHVTDDARIASFGVATTPALVVDDSVVVSGRVPTVAALKQLLAAGRRQEDARFGDVPDG
jgi:small redox-active disulfide protein 2